jgi:hypothetical protein
LLRSCRHVRFGLEMITRANFDQESPSQPLADREDETTAIPADWLAEFEAAARRPLETRIRYSFIHTYKPVMDDAKYRSFDTMEDYRRWCEENLPSWLGYGRV